MVEARSKNLPVRDITPLPKHVAIIMDGNGRWAEKRGLPRLAGHHAGTNNVREVVECFNRYKVKNLTLYAFSTENWSRPGEEVNGLLSILALMIDRETQALHQNKVKLGYLGRLTGLPPELQTKVHYAVDLTNNNPGMILNVAFDYGGRAEILEAIRRIINDGIPPEDITESLFNDYLYTAELPEPDLIIRTGGEMRLSNFLIWQTAYSEFYSTRILWPDFNEQEVEKALVAYSQRERRFGGLNAE